MPAKKSTLRPPLRLSREKWLARALYALVKHGERVLTVEALVREIGVSRGSFYWHFRDRSDFVRQLVQYWSATYTENVPKQVEAVAGTVSDRLLALMDMIVRSEGNLYEVAVRAWASHDPLAAELVKKVDQFRIDYVRSLFSKMGFENEELEARVRAFVVYFSLESGLFVRKSKQDRINQLKHLHAFFTRR
jgi:AcrR family transcriptional regulator